MFELRSYKVEFENPEVTENEKFYNADDDEDAICGAIELFDIGVEDIQKLYEVEFLSLSEGYKVIREVDLNKLLRKK